MVQYVIKSEGKIPSWKIVEVQGELALRDEHITGKKVQNIFVLNNITVKIW